MLGFALLHPTYDLGLIPRRIEVVVEFGTWNFSARYLILVVYWLGFQSFYPPDMRDREKKREL